MKSVCVFCGSRTGTRPEYTDAGRRVGELLARKGVRLIYGGASIGVMGALADAVLSHGGTAVGIIPHGLKAREVAHGRLSEMRVVGSMHERKALMNQLADGFLALPGGMGTLDELCETITWAQLGIHAKPCALLDVAGYWDPFKAMLDRAVSEGFVPEEHRRMILVGNDPEELFERMERFQPLGVRRWLEPSET